MKSFFGFLFLIQAVLSSIYDQLESVNKQIEYYETVNYLLTQRRHYNYNYSDLQVQPFKMNQNNNSKSYEFTQGLQLSSFHQSGQKSFLFFMKYTLFVAEVFPNVTKIYQSSGLLVHQINASINFMSIVKATIDYELCYLETNFQINCGKFEGNISQINYKRTSLNVSVDYNVLNQRLKHVHIQKYEGSYFFSILLDQKQIYVYNSQGKQKSKFVSNAERVVKYLDHNPYPMIVGTDRIAFLQPFKGTQSSLGCPVIQGQVLTAEVQTPFSNTFYLLTDSQIVVMQYSLKKTQKHCKITHRIPITSGNSDIKMLYPTLILNNTFVNMTDTLKPPQLPLPIYLCEHNSYETQYRNSEHYLLHRCCNKNNCTSNLYLRSKKGYSSSTKHYKYLVMIIIVIGIAFKFWNKKQNKSNTTNQISSDPSTDRMVKFQRKLIEQKKRNLQQQYKK